MSSYSNRFNKSGKSNLFHKPTIRIVDTESLGSSSTPMKTFLPKGVTLWLNTSPEPLYSHSCDVFFKNAKIWNDKRLHIPSAIGAYLISVNIDNPNCKIFTIWMKTWAGYSYKLEVIPNTSVNIPSNSNVPIMVGLSYVFSNEFLEDNTVFVHLTNLNIKIKFESRIETLSFVNDLTKILCDDVFI